MIIVIDRHCKSYRQYRIAEADHAKPVSHQNGRPIRFKSPLAAARYMVANHLSDGASVADVLKSNGFSAS